MQLKFVVEGKYMVITGMIGNNTFVRIPKMINGFPVMKIGEKAFQGSQVEVVEISGELLEIGDKAFYGSKLQEITGYSNVIGASAFAGCKSLEVCELCGVREIKDRAFVGCSKLTTLVLGKDITSIGADTFKYVPFKNEWGVIGDGIAVAYNGKSKAPVIPSDVKVLAPRLFYNSTINEIKIEDNIEEIGEECFSYSSVSKVSISGKLSKLPSKCFSYCHSLSSIQLSPYIKSIGKECFLKCVCLQHINLPMYCLEVQDGAFRNDISLNFVHLNMDCRSIGKYAFKGCMDLRKISIPTGVLSISPDSFEGCYYLEEVVNHSNVDLSKCFPNKVKYRTEL